MARLYRRALDAWGRISRKWRVTIVAVGALFLAGSSFAGYRQWQYIQHDNRFCTTCHLMRDPFARFSTSAHSKLECHNCHRATLREELHQLYATMVERPTEVTKHAYVPNEVCARCHVRGDSTRWRIIANTAGHRVHLESRDPALRGLQCVKCHSVSLHEFAPVDRTCGQAGCHTNVRIALGGMGQVEIHCTTCHNFLGRTPEGLSIDSLGRPLTPRAQQCLSCHTMQQRVRALEIGSDPHRGVCGDCHNPHTQTKPQDVGCTNGTCHATWRTVAFHIGVPHPERCTTCHVPHSWRAEGANCVRCHANVEREAPSRRRAPSPRSDGDEATVQVASASNAVLAALLQGAPRARVGVGLPRFSHGDHRAQGCATCHSSRVRHGELMVRGPADCQRCHHQGEGRDRCAACHTADQLRRPLDRQARTFRLAVGGGGAAVTRHVPFDHQRHTSVTCVRCHSNPLSRAPDGADCASCHANHHQAASTCTRCHWAANALAKHRAADHPNCASASCHGARAAGLPSTREACLTCHRTQTQHVPGRACEQCHRVMEPEGR